MLVDARTYTIKPGRMAEQLKIYGELGFPVQLKHIGQPLCYLQAESGELNTLLHLWVYESATDREQRRAAMMKDPEWLAYLEMNAEAGYLIKQVSKLMSSAPFAPIKR